MNFGIFIVSSYGVWQIPERIVSFLKSDLLKQNAECYWISSWSVSSNDINQELSIPKFGVLGVSTGNSASKVRAIKEFAQQHPNDFVIAIDDDIEPTSINEPNVTLITPNSSVGLSQLHLDYLTRWLTTGGDN